MQNRSSMQFSAKRRRRPRHRAAWDRAASKSACCFVLHRSVRVRRADGTDQHEAALKTVTCRSSMRRIQAALCPERHGGQLAPFAAPGDRGVLSPEFHYHRAASFLQRAASFLQRAAWPGQKIQKRQNGSRNVSRRKYCLWTTE